MNKYEKKWKENFELAKKYFEERGNLLISNDYITEDGIKLGNWINTQRKSYKGKENNKMSQEQIEKLNSIGMVWDVIEEQWEQNFQLAKKYYNKYGNLLIPFSYITEDGVKLGKWINIQRKIYKNKKNNKITTERILKLNSINMIWNPFEEQWEENFQLAKEYYDTYGDLIVPSNYEINNIKLGNWISTQRRAYKGNGKSKITRDQIDKLNSIGMVWEVNTSNSISFNEVCIFYYIDKYFKDAVSGDRSILNGKELDIYIPSLKMAIEYDGANWHKDINKDLEKDKLCKERNIKLIRIRESKCIDFKNTSSTVYKLKDTSFNILSLTIQKILKNEFNMEVIINISSDYYKIHKSYKKIIKQQWKEMLQLAKEYFNKCGNLLISANYITEDGVKLGSWINTQRRAYKGRGTGKISPEQIVKLESIGMVWDPFKSQWEENFQLAKEYYKKHGNLLVSAKYITEDGVKLGDWINTQRRAYIGDKGRKISVEQIAKLDSIDMVWEVQDTEWENKFKLAGQYFEKQEDLLIPRNYITEDGIKLGAWIGTQRKAYKCNGENRITIKQIEKLNSIGMVWDPYEEQWGKHFKLAKDYYRKFGNLLIPNNYITEDGIKLGVWIINQRQAKRGYGTCKINPEQIEKLNSIGMVWNIIDAQWDDWFQLAEEYYKKYGNLLMPLRYKTENNVKLGSWIVNQRQAYKNNENGVLSNERKTKLESINMVWDVIEEQWEQNFQLAKKYYNKYGNLLIPFSYITKDGVNLGYWIGTQRQAYKDNGKSKITVKQIEKLESIGMIWDVKKGV